MNMHLYTPPRVDMTEMVRRDTGLAALVGAIPGHNFGYAPPSNIVPRNYGMPMGRPRVGFGDEYGFGSPQYGFGYSPFDPAMNIGFGAPPMAPHPAAHPHARPHHQPHPHHAPAHHPSHPAHPHFNSSTEGRTLLLDPNRNSTVKVERYSFSFSPVSPMVLTVASNQGTYTQQPSASIKGQRVVMNAPQENFVFVQSLQIANVNVIVGGQEDANTYSGRSQGVMLDLPRLDPQNRATASSNYTGSLPPGFTANVNYFFVVTLQGPSTLAGGYGQ